MAQKVTTTITDDIDEAQGIQTPAAETLTFGFGGRMFEIDLSEENAQTMKENFGFYADHAREVGTPRRDGRSKASRGRSREVRTWAKQQGLAVTERGRIPASVQAAYDAGH